jgi:hypothetical protein
MSTAKRQAAFGFVFMGITWSGCFPELQLGMIAQTADRRSRGVANAQDSEKAPVAAASLFCEPHWQRQRNGVAEVAIGKRAGMWAT